MLELTCKYLKRELQHICNMFTVRTKLVPAHILNDFSNPAHQAEKESNPLTVEISEDHHLPSCHSQKLPSYPVNQSIIWTLSVPLLYNTYCKWHHNLCSSWQCSPHFQLNGKNASGEHTSQSDYRNHCLSNQKSIHFWCVSAGETSRQPSATFLCCTVQTRNDTMTNDQFAMRAASTSESNVFLIKMALLIWNMLKSKSQTETQNYPTLTAQDTST